MLDKMEEIFPVTNEMREEAQKVREITGDQEYQPKVYANASVTLPNKETEPGKQPE